MKKPYVIVLLFVCILAVGTLSAQPQTMSGFVACAITQDNTYSVVGQPFVGQSSGHGYQVSEGIAQSQLERVQYNAIIHEGEAYDQNGFHYPSTTEPGMHLDQLYVVHGAQYNYDLLKMLRLVVLGPFTCGDLVYDADLHEYRTVSVAGYCWTQDNLRSEHYPDGTSVDGMVYQCNLCPDQGDILDTYGRLYTWCSAMNLPGGCNSAPVPGDNGYVQGLCPWGWHVPTVEEVNALNALSADMLRSETHWISPNSNTNTTNFSALPAGSYSAGQNRFEGLLTWTAFWTMEGSPENAEAIAFQLPYYCDAPIVGPVNRDDALSVRCVKDNE